MAPFLQLCVGEPCSRRAGVGACSALLALCFAAGSEDVGSRSHALATTALHALLSSAVLPRLTSAAVLAVSLGIIWFACSDRGLHALPGFTRSLCLAEPLPSGLLNKSCAPSSLQMAVCTG